MTVHDHTDSPGRGPKLPAQLPARRLTLTAAFAVAATLLGAVSLASAQTAAPTAATFDQVAMSAELHLLAAADPDDVAGQTIVDANSPADASVASEVGETFLRLQVGCEPEVTGTPDPDARVALDPDACTDAELRTVRFELGDGRIRDGAATSLDVRYETAGMYELDVVIVGRTSGAATDDVHVTRTLQVQVAPASGDLPVAFDAADMFGGFATQTPQLCGVGFAALHQIPSALSGRALLCPDPSQVYTSTTIVEASLAQDEPTLGLTAGDPIGVNGLTGIDCRTSAAACGLDAAAFVTDTSSPLGDCTDGDCPTVETLLALDSDPARCEDGWRQVRDGANYVASTSGLDLGCVNAGELTAAVIGLVDGPAATADERYSTGDTLVCDGTPSYAIARSAHLGLPSLAASQPGGTPDTCDPALPATRMQAYALVAGVLGLEPVPLASLDAAAHAALPADVLDRHLGGSAPGLAAPLPADDAGLIVAGLQAGLPLVGDQTCADGTAGCLGTERTITRGQLAALLAAASAAR